jgi:hypothetical protein
MPYKVLDIYKDLPNTNCGDCGKATCFAFATSVYLEGTPISNCPHLEEAKAAEMQAKLAAGQEIGEGTKDESHVQALAHLQRLMRGADFALLAERSASRFEPGPPETLLLDFLGRPHELTADEVIALKGDQPSVWIKIFLYIYVTRATGAGPAGEWVAFRELPNSVSKSKTFEGCAQGIADGFATEPDELDNAAKRLGGEPLELGSADRAYRFQVLPRVAMVLLFWRATEEFGARGTLLLDRNVLDYLDQEAIVFMAEAFEKMMVGGDVGMVIP